MYLLDLRDYRSRDGHYGPWLAWFAKEFLKRFEYVEVVTPSTKSAKALFGEKFIRGNRLGFRKLPKRFNCNLALPDLLRGRAKVCQKSYFFIMWGYDLRNIDLPDGLPPWGTLTCISRAWRAPQIQLANMERLVFDFLDGNDSCRGFFQPDNYLQSPPAKSIWIPGIEDVACLQKDSQLVTEMKGFASGAFSIGVFGILTGPRCLDALLDLAERHPEIRFVMAGVIRDHTLSESSKSRLAANAHGNLYCHDQFIASEAELNSAIASVDAVFIDGRNYVVHSGIASKAMHHGKAIVSPEGNSWTCDMIRDAGAGFIYDDPDDDLKQLWEKWLKSGGAEAGKIYLEKHLSSEKVAAAFDAMTKALTQEPEVN